MSYCHRYSRLIEIAGIKMVSVEKANVYHLAKQEEWDSNRWSYAGSN